jgi:hypothetical protein
MKKFVNKYYANLNDMASGTEYLNAVGVNDAFDAIGDNFNSVGGYGWANADAPVQSQRAALPYILTIANATTADITSVPLFYGNLYAKNSAALPAGVTYSVTNFSSYDAFLMQTTQNQFRVAKTYWTSDSAAQVTGITFTVINRNADGRELRTPIVPILNKFANQNTVNDNDTPYTIDGNTEVVLSTLYSAQTLIVHFYPEGVVNTKKELSGQNPVTSYSSNPYVMGLGQ